MIKNVSINGVSHMVDKTVNKIRKRSIKPLLAGAILAIGYYFIRMKYLKQVKIEWKIFISFKYLLFASINAYAIKAIFFNA